MLKNACEILEKIEATAKSTEKKKILKSVIGTEYEEDLKFLLDTALNPFLIYGVKNFKESDKFYQDPIDVVAVREVRDELVNREVTGNTAKALLENTISVADDITRKWLKRVFKKNLRAGITAKTVNKIFPNLIPTFDIGLCDSFKDTKLPKGDWIIEPKLDGLRCLCFIDENSNCKFMSRGNKEFNNTQIIQEEIKKLKLKNLVLDGEFFAENWNETISILSTEIEHPLKDKLILYVFDILTMNEWKDKKTVSLKYRKNREGLLSDVKNIITIEYVPVRDYDHAKNYYDKLIEAGEEGAVLKNFDSEYPFKRSKNWLKWKSMITVEVRVIGFEEGTGRNKEKLGALVCEYKNTQVKVGSGFSDEQRQDFWTNSSSLQGKLVEVQTQEVTKDGSLRFPVFLRVREYLN